MKYIMKRIVAYLIDIIFVTTIVTFIVSNAYINKDYNKYVDVYDEYDLFVQDYTSFTKDLDKYTSDLEISIKEYDKLDNKSDKYAKFLNDYKDKKITEKELKSIKSGYESRYVEKSNDYGYEIKKLSTISSIISIMFILLYFVIIQYYFNGQTIGKRLMKIRVISNNGKKLNLLNYLVRSLILNEVVINTLSIIFLFTLSKNNYFIYNKIIYVITYVIEMTLIFMMVFDKDHRGLHDYLSNTKVVENERNVK